MSNLNFSLISTIPLTKACQQFKEQCSFVDDVNIQQLNWQNAWSKLVHTSVSRIPEDVAEVGTTWIEDLRSMGTLHAFTQREVEAIGDRQAFIPASWNSCLDPKTGKVWSIPWTLDTRLIFYRKSILKKVGLDPYTAFDTDEAFKNTLQRLKKQGVPYPLTIPTRPNPTLLHVAASWVWDAGGSFLSLDGKKTGFAQPEALEGLQRYFELGQFLSPDARDLEAEQSDKLFSEGKAAVAISGPWLLFQSQSLLEDVGFTLLPGVPFIGGSNLVIWQHSVNLDASLALVEFLTNAPFQNTYFVGSGGMAGYMPTRLESLSSPAFAQDLRYRAISEGLKKGRSFKLIRGWGPLETRLNAMLSKTWSNIFSDPERDYRAIVDGDIKKMAGMLDVSLERHYGANM
ncbi:MAG: extracellular solute-binding protein [Anaerolineales bacterium]